MPAHMSKSTELYTKICCILLYIPKFLRIKIKNHFLTKTLRVLQPNYLLSVSRPPLRLCFNLIVTENIL